MQSIAQRNGRRTINYWMIFAFAGSNAAPVFH
jgi:hypothetical protein